MVKLLLAEQDISKGKMYGFRTAVGDATPATHGRITEI
jgi:hypothetical protein